MAGRGTRNQCVAKVVAQRIGNQRGRRNVGQRERPLDKPKGQQVVADEDQISRCRQRQPCTRRNARSTANFCA